LPESATKYGKELKSLSEYFKQEREEELLKIGS
jgi:hypothetical protein